MSGARHRTPALDPLQREAVAWVQRLLSGQATSDDARLLESWRARSPAHEAAFAEASRAWSDIGPAARALGRDGETSSLVAQLRSRRAMGRRALLGGGLAAAAAAVVYGMVDPPFELWPSWAEMTADYRTATGEQRQITLADQVSIRMNTQTSLALRPPEGLADRVELIAGEASFATAPQAQRSLMVLAADGRTIGSGAVRFDLRYLTGAEMPFVCVTCFDGQVRVERGGATAALAAGQQLRYDARGLSGILAVDPDVAAAWQRGIVVFHATLLAEVVEEINRYRPGRIILMNAALAQKPVSGRFRIDRMEEILARLQQAFDARIRALPGGIVLLG